MRRHNTTSLRSNYLDVQLAAVSTLENEQKKQNKIQTVAERGQKLFFDSRGVGSLIAGDTNKLSKFKTVFSCQSQCCPMFLYHFFGIFALPFALVRWGYSFTRHIGLAPCLANGRFKGQTYHNFTANFVTPYILVLTGLLHTVFNPDNDHRPTNNDAWGYRFLLLNMFPPIFLFFTWLCRIIS